MLQPLQYVLRASLRYLVIAYCGSVAYLIAARHCLQSVGPHFDFFGSFLVSLHGYVSVSISLILLKVMDHQVILSTVGDIFVQNISNALRQNTRDEDATDLWGGY